VSEIIKANTESQIAITDAEIKGAETLFKVKPDTIAIFVLPPTFEEWMKRLKNRGEMSQAEFKRRLASAIAEFDFAIESNLFTFIVNDDINKAVERINNIVTSEVVFADKQQKYLELVISLNNSTKKLFSTLD
jgi:guanylate kinase